MATSKRDESGARGGQERDSQERQGQERLHPSRRRLISRVVYAVLLAGASILFILVVRPFILPVLLAAITAGIFFPMTARFEKAFRGNMVVAAGAELLVIIILVIIPIGALGYFVVMNIVHVARTVSVWGPDVHRFLREIISLGQQIGIVQSGSVSDILSRANILQTLQQYSSGIAARVTHFLGGTVRTILLSVIYLYSLFFFLRDGPRILRTIVDFVPLERNQKRAILDHFVSVSRATIKGTLLMGLLLGTIGFVGFTIAGVGQPLLLAVVMGILGALPNFGPILVWLPAGIYSLAIGKTFAGLLLIFGVGGLVGITDYVVRPRLIGDDIKMHDLLVFFGIFGGIALFGISGILIGPIAMAIFIEVWSTFRVMYASDYRAADSGELDEETFEMHPEQELNAAEGEKTKTSSERRPEPEGDGRDVDARG